MSFEQAGGVFPLSDGWYVKDKDGNIKKFGGNGDGWYVGQKIPYVEGAEIFNDYKNNTSNIPYAHVEGRKNSANIKVFLISDYSENSVTLYSVDGIKEGDKWNIHIFDEKENKQIKCSGKVDKIEGNVVTLIDSTDGKKDIPLKGLDFKPSPKGSLLSTFIVNGGTVGSHIVEDFSGSFSAHAEGNNTTASLNAHAEGVSTTASGYASHAEGGGTTASSDYTHAEGYQTSATGDNAHAEGGKTKSTGRQAHAEGIETQAVGDNSHAEGSNTVAEGKNAHAEGQYSVTKKKNAHAEGYHTVAEGENAHAEGNSSIAKGESSHAEGNMTTASRPYAHAEGSFQQVGDKYILTTASGTASHAEGQGTLASGNSAHSEGRLSEATAVAAHAEGFETKANGAYSHAEGRGTIATQEGQHAEGRYNYVDENNNKDYMHVVGGGNNDADRRNIYTLDKNGNGRYFGEAYVKNTKKLATQEYVDDAISLVSGKGDGSLVLSNYLRKDNEKPYTPETDYNPAHKKYVDDTFGNAVGVKLDATGAEAFNDYQNNTSNIPYAHVEGRNNNATLRGFYITNYNYTSNTITLGSVDGIEIGMPWYVFINTPEKQERYTGYVEKINGNTLTLTGKKLPAGFTPSKTPSYFGTFFVNCGEIGTFEVTDTAGEFYVHLEGRGNKAFLDAHAEGTEVFAGYSSHAEGRKTNATGQCSHAEGYGGSALGEGAHVEGASCTAKGNYSHAEGYYTEANENFAHSEGQETDATGLASHAEGLFTEATNDFAHAEGRGSFATGVASHAEGDTVHAIGDYSHAEGMWTRAENTAAHAEGYQSEALNHYAHAEGEDTTASGKASHAEGRYTTASGTDSHAEGYSSVAGDAHAHAEGNATNALNASAHAEGVATTASGKGSHAEGNTTTASGNYSHAEGQETTASGVNSHAEGGGSKATAYYAHAEGTQTEATAIAAHAEGGGSKATAYYSHAEGFWTIASGNHQHVQGRYNIKDLDGEDAKYAHIVGNGSASKPSNAYTLGWDGTGTYAGDVYAQNNQKLATEKYVGDLLSTKKSFDSLLYDDEGNLHILLENVDVVDPVWIGGGGGSGSGGGSTYTITLKNLMEGGKREFTVSEGQTTSLSFRYSSVDGDGYDDGPGTGTIYVNESRVATFEVKQGDNPPLDVTKYLSAGINTVKIRVENSEGGSRQLVYRITKIVLSLRILHNEFSTNRCEDGDVYFYYTPIGEGAKTIHFFMDGEELGKSGKPINPDDPDDKIVVESQEEQLYKIPVQSHRGHVFEAYCTMDVDTLDGKTTLTSNVIKFAMIWADRSNTKVCIASTFDVENAKQGENLAINYIVYDNDNTSTKVVYKVLSPDGTEYSSKSLTVACGPVQTWSVQDYPEGAVTFRIEAGDIDAGIGTPKEFTVNVEANDVKIERVTDALLFEFTAEHKSNNEDNPAHWETETENGPVIATFEGVGFAGADGWLSSADGSPMLRLLPGSQMSIPFKLFATERKNRGVTVEVEMATHNVRDYDSIVMSCLSGLSGGVGFKIASQYAQINSRQKTLSMQFKEDERVRISFAVEQVVGTNRLVYVYVDGVMCGAIQYLEGDNFKQDPAVGITIGAESSGIDLFRIMFHDRCLSRKQILQNYIADRPTLAERLNAHTRNNILDNSGKFVIQNLPATLPYMIISCDALPQHKRQEGEAKIYCSIQYVNKADQSRSFTAEDVEIDVQGTTSAEYRKKNFKIKFDQEKGIIYSYPEPGMAANQLKYKLTSNAIETNVFTLKADVASSEGANNVELVKLFNDTVPHTLPPNENDPDIPYRWGIDGYPCIVFWQHQDSNGMTVTKFWGKYNFNNDKGTPEVFGLTEGCESWEIKNNTSERSLFKISDYTDGWMDDFESRYPKYEEGETPNFANLKILTDWIASTNRKAATEKDLSEICDYSTYEYGGKTYTKDTKEYRLAKFKKEFEEHFVKTPMIYYYVFTEVFLLTDSRAKNFFPSTYDGKHWLPLPYDMDTALGINNEGTLMYEYNLEDTDDLSDEKIFQGRESVLWNNVRDAFPDDIKNLYRNLRTDPVISKVFNYGEVAKRFEDHQSVWPEAVWNEDAYEKYLEPLTLEKSDASYLPKLQGNKASQRNWWLFNGFKYRDSKYHTGDAAETAIQLFCNCDLVAYNKEKYGENYKENYEENGTEYYRGITVKPYSHIHPAIKYGQKLVTDRGWRNQSTTLAIPDTMTTLSKTEVYIYSADRLIDVGDLSMLHVGYANFSKATKLQRLKLGDAPEDGNYRNEHLTGLDVGSNELLAEIDVQNCVNLAVPIDLSNCCSIQTVKAKGTAITGVKLPVGGKVKTLELPATITDLVLRNQKEFETLDIDGCQNISVLRVENTPNVPVAQIVKELSEVYPARVYIDAEWSLEDEDSPEDVIDKLKKCKGMDADENETEKAVVQGRLYVKSISEELFEDIFNSFPKLTIVKKGENGEKDKVYYLIRYLDYDGEPLYKYIVIGGADANAIDPVEEGEIDPPTRDGSADVQYKFNGFGTLPTNIQENTTLYAQYIEKYAVRFYDYNGDLLYEEYVEKGKGATYQGEAPTRASTAEHAYTFIGWDTSFENITEPCSIRPVFEETVRTYTVQFWKDIDRTELLYTASVPYGSKPSDFYPEELLPTSDDPREIFTKWFPDTPVHYNTYVVAVFDNPNALNKKTWEEISNISKEGTADNYFAIGDCKAVKLNGQVGTINLNTTYYVYILGFNHNSEIEGGGISFGTFKTELKDGVDICLVDDRYNKTATGEEYFNMNSYAQSAGNGWKDCSMRYSILGSVNKNGAQDVEGYDVVNNPVGGTLMAALPQDLREVMKPITKYTDNVGRSGEDGNDANVTATMDYLPLLSEYEVFGERAWANRYEQNYQKQYAYFSAGNSKIKYQDAGQYNYSHVAWWLRSPADEYNGYFCLISVSADSAARARSLSGFSLGVSPVFLV